ncbi:Transcriptional regulator, LysR family [Desulfosarcina cetonica]|uniref:LysR family transcriptional regulator n=1 Tax=Desulfosarcina cetonica TaxID=90730 RepID=UPI00155DD01F|nr:LysR family transcriptional regulator [Desulfosarcina cetonica]VTR69266.1 Transcriptional regulator, LysR family [Desulfosarcina cetonica]
MRIELPIDLLQTFASAAEAGSFTRAGEIQHITQSAVSMQMKRLETNVGRPLFKKNGRQVRLTPDGETLLEHAHRILTAHNDAVAAFSNPELFGRVRFGCAEDYAARFLPSVLPGFRKAFPRIRVDIHSAPGIELYEALKKEALDLCLLESIADDRRMVHRESKNARQPAPCSHCIVEGGQIVHREPLVWVTSRSGAAHKADPLPLAVYHKGCVYREWAEKSLQSVGRRYWLAFVSPSISSILAAVKSGLAVAPIGLGSMEESLRPLRPEHGFPLLPVTEVSLHRASSADNELVDCFANYVAEAFRSVRPSDPVAG